MPEYSGHIHNAESFCLMQYRDIVNGEVEQIWNSRAGVTPFCIRSLAGNEARHINLHRDLPLPTYVPDMGSRVFITLSQEAAKIGRALFVEKHWSDDMQAHFGTKEEAVKQLVIGIFERGHSVPELVVVDENLAEYFERRAQDLQGLTLVPSRLVGPRNPAPAFNAEPEPCVSCETLTTREQTVGAVYPLCRECLDITVAENGLSLCIPPDRDNPAQSIACIVCQPSEVTA